MVDNFKEQIRIAQANFANPANLAQPVENGVVAPGDSSQRNSFWLVYNLTYLRGLLLLSNLGK